ncbi:TIGR01777 family oxidoreductase [Micrococcales bacterium 31B]|nr:TIGR01777 family oxidoreductase [Micrococcales bacterium 31B]
MKVLLAGASGMIGTEVARAARSAGHEVRSLVRRETTAPTEYQWDPANRRLDGAALEWADAVIGLSGASVARVPWTDAYRKEILRSRLDTTETLARGLADAEEPPLAWVNASASGFYGNRPGETLTESSPGGDGFLADVCAQWETASESVADRLRVVKARTGIVIGGHGAMRPLVLTARFGVAARMGRGSQHWPWISLRDEAAALLFLATESTLRGAVNLAGPTPATSEQITRGVSIKLRRPHLLAAPEPVLRFVLRGMADDMLLSDQLVVPEKLVADGFRFTDETCDAAIAAALATKV